MKKVDGIKGFHEIKKVQLNHFIDERGSFTKIYSKQISDKLNFTINEVFFSVSNKNVFRGFHKQENPYEISKIVFCINGEVNDYFIDLRKDSKNYGKYDNLVLSDKSNIGLYIPEGFAHGYKVLSDKATILYLQSGDYISEFESGINPLSLNLDLGQIILSERDKQLPNFADY